MLNALMLSIIKMNIVALWLPLALHPNLLELWAGICWAWHAKRAMPLEGHITTYRIERSFFTRQTREVGSLRWKKPGKITWNLQIQGHFWHVQLALRRLLGQGNQWTSRVQQTRKLLAWLHGWNSSRDNCGPNVCSEPGQVQIVLPITTYGGWLRNPAPVENGGLNIPWSLGV